MTAALPVRPATKPLQPATSSTDRRPAISPGTTSRQPPGVRPSPRGGRSTMRAETKTTRPRRFCAAASAGPTVSSTSASRTWAAGQASRSGSTTAARRSPGSSRPQPPRLAKWTVSEAAARTAASSDTSSAGPRGSSTISGRESASEISFAPSARRRGRRSASGCATRASPRGARAGRRSPSRPARSAPRGRGRRSRRRRRRWRGRGRRAGHEHLVGVLAADDPLREPERVAQDERRRGEHPAPASARTRPRARARARVHLEPHRLGEQRLVDPPGGSGSRPRRASTRSGSGWSSSTLRAPGRGRSSPPRRPARSTPRSRRRAGSAPRP